MEMMLFCTHVSENLRRRIHEKDVENLRDEMTSNQQQIRTYEACVTSEQHDPRSRKQS